MSVYAFYKKRAASESSEFVLDLDSSDADYIIFNGPSNVQTQRDKDIRRNHFSQLASGSQPEFQTNVQNGLSSILYGVNDRLEGVNDFQTGTAYTIYIVCGFAGGIPGMLFNNYGVGNVRQIGISRRSDVGPQFAVYLRDSSANVIVLVVACPATAHCLLTIQYASGAAIGSVNGGSYASAFNSSYIAESLAGNNSPYIGSGRFAGGGGYFAPYSGHIDQMRFIPGLLPPARRDEKRAELITKWGLPT